MQPELPLFLSVRAENAAQKRRAAGPCVSPGSGFAPLQLHGDAGNVKKPNFIKGKRREGVSWEVKWGMGRA